MTQSQTIAIIITSVAACACIFFAAYDVRSSNGKTARAFSALLFSLALGIVLVTVAELADIAPSVGTGLIIGGRVIQMGGVLYFLRHLRQKDRRDRMAEAPNR
jgi:predicted membrane channel-forming protein YqfA (hemolysin III family)